MLNRPRSYGQTLIAGIPAMVNRHLRSTDDVGKQDIFDLQLNLFLNFDRHLLKRDRPLGFFEKLLEARVAAQRVPPRHQFQLAIVG
jgi:hypothetical protein